MNSTNRLMLTDYLLGSTNPQRNYVKNPSGFENTADITVSGATVSRNTTTPLTQIADLQVAFTTAGDYADFSLNSFDNALNGQNCEFRGSYKLSLGASDDVQAQVLQGSNVVAFVSLAAQANAGQFSVNFPCGDLSQTTKVRFTQASGTNASTLNVANLYIGNATNIGTVSQATYLGSLTYTSATGCVWQGTTGSFANASANTNCNTPTVTGIIADPGSKIPGFKIPSLGAGTLHVIAHSVFFNNAATGGAEWRFHDGTTGFGYTTANAVSDAQGVLDGSITYNTAQTNLLIQIQSNNGGGGGSAYQSVESGNRTLIFDVYYTPSQSQEVITQNTTPMYWSGNHYSSGGACGWSSTSGSFTDPSGNANCALAETANKNFGTVTSFQSAGNNGPGIVFTPNKTGTFLIMATSYSRNNGGVFNALRLVDGSGQIIASSNFNSTGAFTPSTMAGLYNIDNLSQRTLKIQILSDGSNTTQLGNNSSPDHQIDWTIIDISQNVPMPILVGSVTSGSVGAERIERARVTCNSGGSSINTSSSDWLASVSTLSGGACNYTLKSGVFSATPTCIITPKLNTVWFINGDSSSGGVFNCAANGGSACTIGGDFDIICTGPR